MIPSSPQRQWSGAIMACLLLLAACDPASTAPDKVASATIPAGNLLASELVHDQRPDPGAGECWAEEITPAVIETVTEQAEVTSARPATGGKPAVSATFQSQVQQRIVNERSDVWFRVPCPEQIGPEIIASLQRALKVRGLYRDQVTGKIDSATATAIRRYQAPQGLDSDILSLTGARQLGLVTWSRDALK